MVGMFVCLCLASQNPFEREFFVPDRTDLGVTPLSGRNDPNSMYRHVRMKLAKFSTLSLSNSYVIKYFCQIADVGTTNRLARHRVTHHIFVIFFSPATSPVPKI